jgi:hypothetical protein
MVLFGTEKSSTHRCGVVKHMGESIGSLPPCPKCGGTLRELLSKRKYEEDSRHRDTDPPWLHREDIASRTIECVN